MDVETIPAPSEVTSTVTEPVSEAVASVEHAADTSIHELSNALNLHGETLRAHGGVLDTLVGNTAAILNRLNDLAATTARAAVDVPAEAAQTAIEAPAEAERAIETEVEDATDEPKSARRRRRRRRR